MYYALDLTEFDGPTSHNYFPPKADPNFYYQILDEWHINNSTHTTRLNFNYEGEINAGLGSSASAAVLLVAMINKRLGLELTTAEIAERAYQLETKKLGMYGGRQDQFASAFGGFNLMEFSENTVELTPLNEDLLNPLLPSLMLVYTGKNRVNKKIQENLKGLSNHQKEALDLLKEGAILGVRALVAQDIEEFGRIMGRSWELKKAANKSASNARIDKIYDAVTRNGAYGGKLCGSGGGGYMILIINPVKKETLTRVLTELDCVEVSFKPDWGGVKVW